MESLPDLNSSNSNKRKRLTNQERQHVFNELLKHSEGGIFKRGSTSVVATKFGISFNTIRRIWKQAKNCYVNGSIDVSNRLLGRVGRKRVQIDPRQVSETPLRRRTNIRSMAEALNVSKSTLHRRIKEGFIRSHSNALKPTLTDENKKARLRFCLSMLEPSSFNDTPTFKPMVNYVHIDEKWFYMTKESQKYYLLPEEDEPVRTCQSKRFITKVMFLAAVTRPRFDSSGNELFSGKIGIFPFTFQEPVKRNSKNRAAGTLETKPISSVTKDVIRECLIQKVLPAIRAKWPIDSRRSTIIIQQDNAKPHINLDDAEFLQATSMNEFDFRLYFQPPNSPDLNVLDLGFFRAIQSLQHQEALRTIDDLVQAVEKSFDNFSSQNLNRVFLTLQKSMCEVMKVFGNNTYRIPHMGKNRLEREGNLSYQIQIEKELVENVQAYLEQ